jgi:RimJ/RimL family protein N-acetyltransferase
MFHIETSVIPSDFHNFILSLGAQTKRQFDQFDNIKTINQVDEILCLPRHNFFGKLDSELIAYAFLQMFPKKLNVVSLGVVMADKYQGHGYGKPLYKHVTDWGLEHDTMIWSAVYEDNLPVLHIHASLGYEYEGTFIDELDDGRSIYSLAKFRHGDRLEKRAELLQKWINLT